MNPSKPPAEILDIAGQEVRISNPGKVVFPEPGLTKLDLVNYYLAVAEGALRGAGGRPMVLKRFPKGIDAEPFFQKRVPENHPGFIDTATLHYSSGTSAEETVIRDAAGLAWVVNLGCLDLNPHPVRAEDLDHPDELRVDLDPMPGVEWSRIVDTAYVAQEVLDDVGLVGWPKTSGSRGLHILVRIEPRWSYKEVRLAAETLAREVEIRAPGLATAKWWKEERGESVFVDFNQNAKDRTVASAYSVRSRPTPASQPRSPGKKCAPHGRSSSRCAQCPHVSRTWVTRTQESTTPPARSTGFSPWLPSSVPPRKPPGAADGSGRRVSVMPLIEVARTKTKPEAEAALEEWKDRHGDVVSLLHPADVLIDGMRGSSSLWYRVRVNLHHIPEDRRPPQEELIADYDPWAGKEWPGRPAS